MFTELLPYITVAISVFLNVSALAFFIAKMSAKLDFHDQQIKEVKTSLDKHITNTQLHRDTQAFSVQFSHIEKQMASIQEEMRQTRDALTQRIDELHRSLVDGQ
jgi:uncharacterized protein YabN with tetrapyrrole methylase and pyrophosphatase domain